MINETRLGSMLYQWSAVDVVNMVVDAGLEPVAKPIVDAYAGQAMIVIARKPLAPRSNLAAEAAAGIAVATPS